MHANIITRTSSRYIYIRIRYFLTIVIKIKELNAQIRALFVIDFPLCISFRYTAAVGIASPLPSNIPMPTPGPSSEDASKWSSVESTTLYMKQGFLTLHCTCINYRFWVFKCQHECRHLNLSHKVYSILGIKHCIDDSFDSNQMILHAYFLHSISCLHKSTSHSKVTVLGYFVW